MPTFDVDAALADGKTVPEIASFLAQTHNFDYNKAKYDGVTDEQIVDFLKDQEAAPAPPEDTSKDGYITGTAKAVQRGVLDIGVQAGKAMEYNPDYLGSGDGTPESRDESQLSWMNRAGRNLAQSAESMKTAAPDFGNNEVKRSVFQGGESAPASMAYAIPGVVGGALGGAAGTVVAPVGGTTAGTIAGAAIGQAPAAGIMYRAQAQQNMDDLDKLRQEGKLKEGLTNQDLLSAAQESGFHEAFGETLSDIPESVLFNRMPFLKAAASTARGALKPGIKEFAKLYAQTWLAEQGGEGYTAAMQTVAQNRITPEQFQADPWQAAKDQAGPTTVMTLFMAGLGRGAQAVHAHRLANTIEDEGRSQEDRLNAAGKIGEALQESAGPAAAKNFLENSADAILNPATPGKIDLSDPNLLLPLDAAERAQTGDARFDLRNPAPYDATQDADLKRLDIPLENKIAPVTGQDFFGRPGFESPSGYVEPPKGPLARAAAAAVQFVSPMEKAGLMGTVGSPETVGDEQERERLINEASLDRNTMGVVTPDTSVLASGATTPAMQRAEQGAFYQDLFGGAPADTQEQAAPVTPTEPDMAKVDYTFQAIKEADPDSLEAMAQAMPQFMKDHPEYRPFATQFRMAFHSRRRELAGNKTAEQVTTAITNNQPIVQEAQGGPVRGTQEAVPADVVGTNDGAVAAAPEAAATTQDALYQQAKGYAEEIGSIPTAGELMHQFDIDIDTADELHDRLREGVNNASNMGTGAVDAPVEGGTAPPAVDQAALSAATHPENDLSEPTDAQKEAGNYQKGHVRLHGMDISIENPAGSVRSGVDPSGERWETKMQDHYGYIKGTVGRDKDHIDMFIPQGFTPGENDKVAVVDQIDPHTGGFDEHKTVIGVNNEQEAVAAYLRNYDQTGKDRIGAVTMMPVADFKEWLAKGNTKKPVGKIPKKNTGLFGQLNTPAVPRADASGYLQDRKMRPFVTAQTPAVTRQPGESVTDYMKRRKQELADRKAFVANQTAMREPQTDLSLTGERQTLSPNATNSVATGENMGQNPGNVGTKQDNFGTKHSQVETSQGKGSGETFTKPTVKENLKVETDRAVKDSLTVQNGTTTEESSVVDNGKPSLESELDSTSDEDLSAMLDDVFGASSDNSQAGKKKTGKAGKVRENNGVKAGKAGKSGGNGWKNVNTAGMSSELAFRKQYEQWVRDGMDGNGPPPPAHLSGDVLKNFIDNLHASVLSKVIEEESPKKTAGKITKEGGIAALEGVKSAMEGLNQLFGGKNRLGSGLAFDEDTYAQAKPHFVKAWDHAKAVGYSLKELIQYFHDQFGKAIRPYLARFLQDVKEGNLTTEGQANTVNQGDTKRDRQENNSDHISGRSQKGNGQPLRQDDQRTEGPGNRALDGVAPEVREGSGEAQPAADGGPGRSRKGVKGNQGTDGLRVPAPRGRRGSASEVHSEATGTGSDRGNGRSGALTEAPATIPAANFTITDDVRLGEGGQTQKYKDNVAAIRILQQLRAEKRRATADEQKALARYVGWGGIPNAFRNSMTGEVKEEWKDRVAELEGLLTKEELETARNSTQNAHYTSSDVVSSIWSAVHHLGFRGGLALEPSVGTGNFIGLMPQDVAGATKFVAAEFDGITAGIAQALYPQEAIFHTPFEKLPLPSEEFDLVIGNPPFGQTSLSFAHLPGINRFSIHNQFFLAGLEALKPGGVQAFVVSRYLLDAKDSTVRQEIAKQAKLLAAVRLPQTAFKDNALTDVVTDIIFLQKLDGQPAENTKPDWIDTVDITDKATGEPMTINSHFAMHPDMIMGTIDRSGSMRYDGDITVKYAGDNLRQDIESALKKAMPAGVIPAADVTADSQRRFKTMADSLAISLSGAEDGSISIDQQTGKLMQVREMKMEGSGSYMLTRVEIAPGVPWSNKLTLQSDGRWLEEVDQVDAQGNKVKVVVGGKVSKRNAKELKQYTDKEVPSTYRLSETDYHRIKDAISLLGVLKDQINLEMKQDSSEAQIEANRKKLNAQYHRFVDTHKNFLSSQVISKLLADMPDGALLLSLESSYKKPVTAAQAKKMGVETKKAEVKPAAILSKRVIFPYTAPEKTSNPQDALAITLSETGRVDMGMLSNLLDKDEAEVVADLHDSKDEPLIYQNPETGLWETADEYLGGNVVQKLNAAKAAGLDKNVTALEKIQPAQWGADKVTVMPGATWVPEEVYSDFVGHLTGEPAKVRFSRATNTFSITQSNDSSSEAKKWGTNDRGASAIVEALLNSRTIRVTYTDREGRVHVDQEATELANMKMEEVKEEFSSWIFRDGDRRRLLVDLFNRKYNVRVNRQRNGQHLQFPGKVPDQIISFRRHQKNGIWRGIVDQFVLYDHAVGAGKTFTGIARAIERKRMGLSRKPMIVVPNHLVEQFAADIYKLYPGARVLAAGKKDLEKSKRRRLFAKIATGDWDAVVVPHSSFAFIGIAPETEARYLENELKVAEEAVQEAQQQAEEDGQGSGWRKTKPLSVKQAEALRDKIKARLEALRSKTSGKDRLLTFEQMGVDNLTVDEAHEFKNLFYNSNMQARGMNPRAGSSKAYDLWLKCRVLRESNGSIAFMTGTPISNSAVEMYGLMRYLAADELQDMGLEHFDSWRAQFVDATTEYEPTESGRGLKEVNRLGRDWSNMRSLMDLYYSFADCVTNDDIKKWYREDNGNEFPIPKVKGGGRVGVNVQPTPGQESELQRIVSEFESLPDVKDVTERNKKRLRLMDQARKISLDVRALNPGAKGEPGGKLEQAAKRIFDIYKKWEGDRGTQLVFLDRSVPKAAGDKKRIEEYDELLSKLKTAERVGDEAEERRLVEALDRYDANEMEELRQAQTSNWNGYQQIKNDLVAMGIPANEVRFVQDANTDEQKQALFDEVNAGSVRVLIGSTPRMGAGTNVQERLVALHHIDVTWKPSDIEQREGRIIRQGNKLLDKYGIDNFDVEILAYTTESTIDAKLWSLNSTKLRMINGIRQYNGEFNMEFDDEDSVGMAEIAAIASGDPLQLERVKLDAEIKKLSRQQSAFNRQQWGVQDQLDRTKQVIKDFPDKIAAYKEVVPAIEQAKEDEQQRAAQRKVTIDGQDFDFASLGAGEGSPYRYIQQKYDQAKKDGDKFSVEIDGETTRSKDKAEDKVVSVLGDGPGAWEMTINGKPYFSKDSARRAIADLANAAMDGKPDDMGETKIGTVVVHGVEMDLSVESEESRDSRGEPVKAIHFYFEKELPGSGAPIRINDHASGSVLKINNKVNLNSLNGLFGVFSTVDYIPRSVRSMQRELQGAKEQLPAIQGQAGAVFPKEQELGEKRDRLADVERELASRAEKKTGAAQGEAKHSVAPATDKQGSTVSIGKQELAGQHDPARVSIVQSVSELPQSGITKNRAQGVYLPGNDQVYLVADNIAAGEWSSVLHHEGFHRAMATGQFADVFKDLERMEKMYTGGGAMAKWFDEARTAAQVDKGKPHYIEEIGAYAVSHYEQSPGVIKKWVDKLVAKAKLFLRQIGIKTELTPAMLREIAARGLRAKSIEAGSQQVADTVPRYSVAKGGAKSFDEGFDEIREKVASKYDILPGARAFITPEYTMVKDPAGKRMIQAAERRQQRKFEFENLILDGTLPSEAWDEGKNGAYSDHFQETHNSFVNTWKGLQPEDRKQAQDDLLEADQSGKWFRLQNVNGYEITAPDGRMIGTVKTKEDGYQLIKTDHQARYGKKSEVKMRDYTGLDAKVDKWRVIDPKGKVVSEHADERTAVQRMMDAEGNHLKNAGRSGAVVDAIRVFREMTNRAFDLQVMDLRKIVQEREDLGLPPLPVDVPDESKRWAIKDRKGKVVATYSEEAEAQAQLHELAKYKPGFAYVNVERQSDIEIMHPAGLQEYIAMIGDLRGSYFPRQRQSGAVQMTAVNQKTGERYLEKYDLWITPGKRMDVDTGEEVTEGKIQSLMRKGFNRFTPLGRRVRELQKQGFSIEVKKAGAMPEDVFSAAQLASSIAAMMDEGLARAEGKPSAAFQQAYAELHKTVVAAMSDIFKQRGALSSRIKRSEEYWKGFETNPMIAGVQYAKGMAGGIAKRLAAQEITMAMTGRDISWLQFKAMQDEKGEPATWEDYSKFVEARKIDPKEQPNLYKEALSWTKEILRNDEQADRIIGVLRGLATLKYLGFRVASAAVNMTNLVQAVPATIASKTGGTLTGAFNQLSKSLGALAAYKRGKASELDKRIFTEIAEKGWDSAQFNNEAASVLRSKAGNAFAKFSDIALWMFGKAEKINRAATIHAAYMQAKQHFPNLSHGQLMEKAKEISDRAHGVYGKETAPAWTRGSANPLRMTFTFAKFSQNYMLNMMEMLGKGDYKNAAFMLLSPAVLGGAGASAATPVLVALAKAFGIGGDDPEEALYSWAADNLGGDPLFRHGLPGLAGITIKGSLQINNPFPTTIEELFGAPGSLFFDMRDAAREYRRGAYGKALEKTLPTGLVAPLKAYREYTEGVTTGSYSRVYYGDQPLVGTGYDAVLRAFSFNPSHLAGIREKQYNEQRVAERYKNEKKELYTKIKKAWIAGGGRISADDWIELTAEVEEYNERVKGLDIGDVQPITKKNIKVMLKRNGKAPKRERERAMRAQ